MRSLALGSIWPISGHNADTVAIISLLTPDILQIFSDQSTGRWEEKRHHKYTRIMTAGLSCCNNRFSLNKTSIPVFRGDGFISKYIKKRLTKKQDPTSRLHLLMLLILAWDY
jgi:hypothetical protein